MIIRNGNKKQIIQGQISSKNLQISYYKSTINDKYLNNYAKPQSDGKFIYLLKIGLLII